jgi:hypothetical protein
VTSLDENPRAKLPRVTARTPFVQYAELVVEIGSSLPISVFNSAVANAGRCSRMRGRPARGCWRLAAGSALCALGYIADDVINALWPAQAVARAPSRDFDRAVRAVDQLTEPKERQEVWKPIRRVNR